MLALCLAYSPLCTFSRWKVRLLIWDLSPFFIIGIQSYKVTLDVIPHFWSFSLFSSFFFLSVLQIAYLYWYGSFQFYELLSSSSEFFILYILLLQNSLWFLFFPPQFLSLYQYSLLMRYCHNTSLSSSSNIIIVATWSIKSDI